MTTLISVHNSDGCVGRCDARCHNAKGPVCSCVCGGKNHGVGHKQAAANTQEHAFEMLEANGIDTEELRVELAAYQPVLLEEFDELVEVK